MPTKTKKPRAGKVKPIRPFKSRAKVVEPPPPTPDELLTAMEPLFDRADAFMATRPTEGPGAGPVNWPSYGGGYTDLERIARELRSLTDQLERLLVPTSSDDDDEEDAGSRLVRQRFETKPGEPVRWSRPGSCLLWIGADIPVMVRWGGLALPHLNRVLALNPRGLFLNSSGESEFYPSSIGRDCNTPEDRARAILEARLKRPDYNRYGAQTFQPLVLLNAEATVQIAARLASPEGAWWQAEISKGPVNAVAPPIGAPIQTSLFA